MMHNLGNQVMAFFYNQYTSLREQRYYHTGRNRTILQQMQQSGRTVLLVTVAFNNVEVVAEQIRALAQHCTDGFTHLIVDNSTDPKARRQICAVCAQHAEEQVYYLVLPENNFYTGWYPSASHGLALNWTWRNVVTQLPGLRYAGLLDHDIFPLKDFSVAQYLEKQQFYGIQKTTEEIWYLWPGYCFYRIAEQTRQMDFKPGLTGDTGAMNYPGLYQRTDCAKYAFAAERLVTVDADDNEAHNSEAHDGEANMQRDQVAMIDEAWVHLINASDWAQTGNIHEKFLKVQQMLKGNNE